MKKKAQYSILIHSETSPIITLISGALAGGFSRTLTAPLDRVKILHQASTDSWTIRETSKYIYKKGNVLAFFKGNGANCLKIIPETSIKFFIFDQVLKWCRNWEVFDHCEMKAKVK